MSSNLLKDLTSDHLIRMDPAKVKASIRIEIYFAEEIGVSIGVILGVDKEIPGVAVDDCSDLEVVKLSCDLHCCPSFRLRFDPFLARIELFHASNYILSGLFVTIELIGSGLARLSTLKDLAEHDPVFALIAVADSIEIVTAAANVLHCLFLLVIGCYLLTVFIVLLLYTIVKDFCKIS